MDAKKNSFTIVLETDKWKVSVLIDKENMPYLLLKWNKPGFQ